MQPTGLTPNQGEALWAKWMCCGLRCVAPQSEQRPREPWMDSSTLHKVMEESAWRRQWFRLQHATLSLKKVFWCRAWQTGVAPLQVAVAHDTLLVHACTVSVQVIRSSKRVHLLVKQGAATMDGTAGHGNCCGGGEWESETALPFFLKKPKYVPKLLCRSSCHLELLRPPRRRWPLCGIT